MGFVADVELTVLVLLQKMTRKGASAKFCLRLLSVAATIALIAVSNVAFATPSGHPEIGQSPSQVQQQLSQMTSYPCNAGCFGKQGPVIVVTYKNNLNFPFSSVTVTGATSSGNTVKNYQTATAAFAPGESLTLPFLVGGLPGGTYSLSTSAAATFGPSVSGTSVIEFQILPDSSLFIGKASDWTLLKGPALVFGGDSPVVKATYANNLDVGVTGIMWLVIHNGVGQTISFSTGTLSPAGGGNPTGTDVVFGLTPGTYNATVFVTSVSFIALSGSASFNFTI